MWATDSIKLFSNSSCFDIYYRHMTVVKTVNSEVSPHSVPFVDYQKDSPQHHTVGQSTTGTEWGNMSKRRRKEG